MSGNVDMDIQSPHSSPRCGDTRAAKAAPRDSGWSLDSVAGPLRHQRAPVLLPAQVDRHQHRVVRSTLAIVMRAANCSFFLVVGL